MSLRATRYTQTCTSFIQEDKTQCDLVLHLITTHNLHLRVGLCPFLALPGGVSSSLVQQGDAELRMTKTQRAHSEDRSRPQQRAPGEAPAHPETTNQS